MDIVIVLVFIAGIVIAFSRRIDGLIEFVALLRPLPTSFIQAIEKYNSFYQSLPAKSKTIFLRRVKQFVRTKTFVPRNIAEVTDEMKALISSSAVQLTFGISNITLRHFERILVYPDDYYSLINRRYHKGEVNPRLKAIVVSWKSFVEGYAIPNDGVNLGLHEMAHALKLENLIKNGEHHFFNLEEYQKWLDLAAKEIKKIRDGKDSIFRKYAGQDEDEFFAVGMELYFEKPQELFDQHPELYKTLSNLLHQDTLQLVK